MAVSKEQWIGNGLIVAGAVMLRIRNWQVQRHWPPLRQSDIIFKADWLSGRSPDNLLTRMGGARQCLTVTVTSEEIRIRPFHLFRLFGDIYGLEPRILKRDITDVRKTRSLWNGERLLITYRRESGDISRFELSGGNLQPLQWAVETGRAAD